jgi:hypothetical protein
MIVVVSSEKIKRSSQPGCFMYTRREEKNKKIIEKTEP